MPKTLMELSGADLHPPKLEEAIVVLIDCQQEYIDGALPLPGVEAALAELSDLLGKARKAETEIIHIAHCGAPGGVFDRSEGGKGAFAVDVAPRATEKVIEKKLPNAFAATDLHSVLQSIGKTNLILGGFMTHMCVSSTARAALDLGYRSTIIDKACATRDLPDSNGNILPAQQIHQVSLAALSDRFALIVPDVASLSGR